MYRCLFFIYICPMKLLKVGKYYVWHGDYYTKEIPKAAGMSWNPTKKRWETSKDEIAVTLIEYAQEPLKSILEGIQADINSRIDLSKAVDANIDIPAPPGLEYFGYQRAGIAYALTNTNTLIGDEMGLGKTIQAIGVINASPHIKRILVVCPASLKLNWERELKRWLVSPKTIRVLTSADRLRVDADIYIANYEIIGKLKWLRIKYDLIIGDECHYLKNQKSQRSQYFAEIRERADKLILLTGTPILNRPIELWNILQLLRFDMKFWRYVSKYCGASEENGWDMSGAQNLDELQQLLRTSVMIRREKADVLTELPPKTRQIIYLDPKKYRKYLDKESKFLSKAGLRGAESVDRMHQLKPKHIAELAKLRHETALAKVPDLVQLILAALESNNKVVVFAHHRDVIDALSAAFDNSVKLTGEMSIIERDVAVSQFQTNPDVRVFIGSIKAAGVGLTLTAANTVIFGELDWVPGNLSQAEDRLHRIGQVDNVLVYHVVVDGSIDAMLAKRVTEKQAIIDQAMRVDVMADLQEKRKAELEALRREITDDP